MKDIIAAALMLAGTGFMTVAAIGLIRLPDLYTRMHAITKAGTLGIGLLLVGVAVHMADLSFTTRAIAVILFVLLTAPVSAHMIGRAGYLGGMSMWRGTSFDQWGGTFHEVVEKQGLQEIRSQSRADNVQVHRSDALHDGDRSALFSELESGNTVSDDAPPPADADSLNDGDPSNDADPKTKPAESG